MLKNNINQNYFKDTLYSKDKIKLNKIIKNIYSGIDNKKDTLHILSKKLELNFNKSELKKFNNYRSVILIGMGGSALGAQAIYFSSNGGAFIYITELLDLKYYSD